MHDAFGDWKTCIGHFYYSLWNTNSWMLLNFVSSITHAIQYLSWNFTRSMFLTDFFTICWSVTLVERDLQKISEISLNDLWLLWKPHSCLSPLLKLTPSFCDPFRLPSSISFSNLNGTSLVSDCVYLYQQREGVLSEN